MRAFASQKGPGKGLPASDQESTHTKIDFLKFPKETPLHTLAKQLKYDKARGVMSGPPAARTGTLSTLWHLIRGPSSLSILERSGAQ